MGCWVTVSHPDSLSLSLCVLFFVVTFALATHQRTISVINEMCFRLNFGHEPLYALSRCREVEEKAKHSPSQRASRRDAPAPALAHTAVL